ncbi:GNAT family N-acetyltransferase [Neisseria gonorrhoeae]|uniref:GNAT family N-acetyltransferase n=1 Tax=Neisseria gonorrhoeae TaxID=485 RepID=UPI0005DC490E|nr:GNAT family protein [Neisseria gonorrhoeae]MCF2973540.1 GNAT family N-acetyltransferase [Neisseria gonorrhoeae]MCF2982671.1 GNAT family N-acetyltransferase [Neisseria gonorrhoeae]MCF2992628.1 GNAT family N-acetyltransferase [Neisseria gonorrhoeae]MCF3003728.1 GNAT family N-acetyltransferase [Neisseria gonorrhoeae]MCF3013440.1 GNAT family N-acetyltransferase [Neisseria gonorrhoeae]
MSERIILPVLSLGGVRLEPLDVHHETGLREAVCDGEVWKLGVTSAPHPDRVADYIGTALATRLAFAVVDEEADRVVGTTAYYHFEPQIPHLDIGFTWYAASAQRTRINTCCKIMLLDYAFDVLACCCVGWRTDILNLASQRAIERLGAEKDGVLRMHMLRKDGSVRDTVVYSMLREDWCKNREILTGRLAGYGVQV